MATFQSVPARNKGFNRVAIVDQKFLEFVQHWRGGQGASPCADEPVLPASAHHARSYPRG